MKKLMAFLLVGIMVFSLTACGSDFEGEWKAVSIEGGNMSADEKAVVDSLISGMALSIKDDGTAVMSIMGQSRECEWEADGDTITLKAAGETIKGEMDGDQLILEENGEKIVFEKE